MSAANLLVLAALASAVLSLPTSPTCSDGTQLNLTELETGDQIIYRQRVLVEAAKPNCRTNATSSLALPQGFKVNQVNIYFPGEALHYAVLEGKGSDRAVVRFVNQKDSNVSVVVEVVGKSLGPTKCDSPGCETPYYAFFGHWGGF